MIWIILEQVSVIQTDWYGGPYNEKAKFYLILSQNEILANELESKGEYKEALKLWLLILNSYPDNIRAKKAIMRLMERGLDFYIDKPYNLSY